MKPIKRADMKRPPSKPGEVLKDIFLVPNGITQLAFAQDLSKLTKGRIKVSTMKTKLNDLIKGRRAMSAELALLVSARLGTNPRMWLGLQSSVDLWNARHKLDLAS